MSVADSIFFWVGSLFPLIVAAMLIWKSWHWRVRRIALWGCFSLILSLIIGFKLTEYSLHLPANAGDHSPGVGVAFVPLVLAFGLAVLLGIAWLTWALIWKWFRKWHEGN